MATIIQWRRDTAANWTSVNPTLANGEVGLELDTEKLKLGNGVQAWVDLPYWSGSGVASVNSGTDITVDNTDPQNPIVNFSGVIPPPGGQVDSVVGGTDITVDASDPANPIVNYTGDGTAQQDPPFAYKPEGEPIVLVLTGQSNAVGATTTPTQPFPVNNNVYDWNNGGSGGTGGTFSWEQGPNLNDPTMADYNDALPYVGMVKGGRGNIGWSAANRIQELTGRDVYVICVGYNAQPIQQWYPGELMANLLNQNVPAALALVPGAPTSIDGFIWMQGEANLQIVSATDYLPQKEYATAFLDQVYGQFVTEGWITDRQTQVAICELSWAWNTYGNTMLWQIQYDANEYFRVISSYGLPTAQDDIHFTPYSLGQLGDISANGFMAGPDPKLKNPQAYLGDLYNVDVATAEQNQVLYYDALTETWKAKTSTSALGIIEFDYRWSTAPNATPASGRVSTNNADPALVTLIYVNETSAPGNDLSLFWDNVEVGDWLNFNAPGDYAIRNNYDVTGPPVKNGEVYTIPVTLFETTGYNPGNNNQVSVFVRYTQSDNGLPPGGTDGQMLYKVGSEAYVSVWDNPPFSVQSVVAGANVTVDNTDPANPVVSAVGGGTGGQVDSVVAGTGISVNSADPVNPVVSSPLAASALQPGDNVSELVNDAGYLDDASQFATAAQGALATTALQPGDNISELNNDAGYLDDASQFATAAQGALADTATQPGNNLSTLTNDEGFAPLTGATAFAVVQALPGTPDPNTIYFVTG